MKCFKRTKSKEIEFSMEQNDLANVLASPLTKVAVNIMTTSRAWLSAQSLIYAKIVLFFFYLNSCVCPMASPHSDRPPPCSCQH